MGDRMLPELLPCPFCGNPVGLFATSNGHENHYVECEECGASGPVNSRDSKAAIAWNRRATQRGGRGCREYEPAAPSRGEGLCGDAACLREDTMKTYVGESFYDPGFGGGCRVTVARAFKRKGSGRPSVTVELTENADIRCWRRCIALTTYLDWRVSAAKNRGENAMLAAVDSPADKAGEEG